MVHIRVTFHYVFIMSQYEQYVCYAYALSVNLPCEWICVQYVKCEGLSVFYGLVTFAVKY